MTVKRFTNARAILKQRLGQSRFYNHFPNMAEKAEIVREIAELTKKRSSYKGRITIFSGYLKSLDSSTASPTTKDISELELRIGKLDMLYAQYDETQTRLECISDNIDQQLAEREEFECRYYKALSQGQEMLANYKRSQVPLPTDYGSHSGKLNPVKLPTIQLPKFSGAYNNWLEFRDTFTSLIHNNDDLDDVNKFHYLRTSLEGSAAVVISSIEFSSSNYNVAWKLMCDRFDNKRLLIQNHVAALFNIEPVTRESATNLKHILDQLNKNLRALESLGEPVKQWDTLLIYIITHKLDSKTYREWEEYKGRLDSNKRIELQDFLDFVRMRTNILDTIEFSRQTPQHNSNHKPSKVKAMVTTQTNDNNSSSKDFCPKCSAMHKLSTCPQFLALSNEERLQLLPTFKVCFNCFSKSHFSNNCKKNGCKICKRKHSVLVHVTDKQKPAVRSESTESVSATPSTTNPSNNLTLSASVSSASLNVTSRRGDVLLSTALIKLYDSNNREHIGRAVLDSGSTSSLLSEKMFRQLNLPYNHIDQSVLGINNASTHINKMCRLRLKSLNDTFMTNLHCFILPSLTDNVPCRSLDISNLNLPTDVCLADPHFYAPASVDLILGADIFWDIIGSQRINLGDDKPTLCETRLGWIISGPMNNRFFTSYLPNPIQCNYVNTNSTTDIQNQDIQNQLARFWNLEEVNISNLSTYSPEQKLCEEHFIKNTTRLEDGRFCVRIPLKENPSVLGDSLQRAKQCFLSLERRLLKQPKLYEMYREFMSEYQSLGHMSECELSLDSNAHFIPHHGVLRESSATTKLRAVFNASSSTTSTNISLNSIQMVGPTVQDDLLSILLRFRQHKYVILADVEKMYRQILVHPDDRYLQRIIWRDNPNQPLKAFELNTVTYGTASAPFLATRCLKQLGLECKDNQIAEIILHDFYVDDLLSGGDDLNVVRNIRSEVTATLASARLPLRKWKSNEPQLVSESTESTHDLNVGGNEPSKTLGLGWQPESDELHFPIGTSIAVKGNSKRDILSVISQIFDPLGLVSPVVIKLKIILQSLWLQNLSWDDPLTPEIQEAWCEAIKNLHVLNNLRVPRRVLIDSFMRLEFHVFSDASERAYGACLYVRSIDSSGRILVQLLLAKSRVAPIKATTIPRLELCGAQVAAKLYEKVISSLRVKAACTVFWTDSTIVLGWLKMLPSKLHTFVRNRVGDILEKTGDCVWRHVPTEENPADYVSRGVSVDTIQSLDMWWSGPTFLKEPNSYWPSTSVRSDSLPETRTELSCLVKTENPSEFIEFDRFSNFNRLRRAVAYMLRFVEACRGRRATTNFLTETELNNSLNVIIRTSQKESFTEYDLLLNKKNLPAKSALLKFNVFLDENNLMRVGGRIRNSEFSYDKKHPLILQSTHRFTQLLFKYEHTKLMHAGPQLLLASIREVYWPIGGRNLAKSTYRRCIRCTRMKGSVVAPIMGDLPRRRLTPGGYPFETVGVDYAGPISSASRQGRGCRIVKVYIAIFICFTTKAIHLELVGDLTTIPTEDYQDGKADTHLTRYQRIEQLRQHFWARWSKEYVSELQKRTKWQTPYHSLELNSLVLLKEENLPPLRWKLGRIVALFPGPDQVARVADVKTASGIARTPPEWRYAEVSEAETRRYVFSKGVYPPKLCGDVYWLDWNGDVSWLERRCPLARALSSQWTSPFSSPLNAVSSLRGTAYISALYRRPAQAQPTSPHRLCHTNMIHLHSVVSTEAEQRSSRLVSALVESGPYPTI
ncbi:uncharacterized protein LOC123877104 [Maniola jurtina]|uniref:uncharacterized protein LOC123877104 n=1 Tax=Maniola jurtina TaxID=191418 RepID=UPI001E686CBA|nr:uncharacterized protein LOC123877104 [Maniola jurtina]